MKRVVGLVALAVLTAGCGGDDDPGSASGSTPAPARTSTSAIAPTETSENPEPSDDPREVAGELQAAIPQIGSIVDLNEDNDENNFIGRPGQYDAATFMEDKRLGCSENDNFDGLSIDCGAKIERWPSQADAQARADDIQQKLQDYGLGAEYDYVRDRLLLRVAGDIKPSEAEAYESAFLG